MKAALGQADRRDQVGGFGDMFARCRIGLVHRAMRGHEGGERARLQQVYRACDKVVVQAKTERSIGAVRADSAIGKGRVTDGEIVDRRQIGAGEVTIDDPGLRLQQANNAGRDRIEFDPGDIGGVAIGFRH
ncbi:hypothetical protein D3C73_1264590 [compost metagenome]